MGCIFFTKHSFYCWNRLQTDLGVIYNNCFSFSSLLLSDKENIAFLPEHIAVDIL